VDDALDDLLDAGARAVLRGEEDGADAVVARGGKRDARRGQRLAQELVGRLDQDAGAVAGVRFASTGAAVLQVDQDLEAAGDHGVGFAPGDVHDEPDAACVVLERRIVETAALVGVGVLGCHALVIAERGRLGK